MHEPIAQCRLRLRVRYGEVDRMGITYYAHYLDWFTEGRTELFRRIGMTYLDLEEMGILLPVLRAGCRYHRPARYDEEIEVLTSAQISPTRMLYEYRLERGQVLLAEGFTEHAFVRGKDLRPMNVRREFPAIWERVSHLPPYRPGASGS